MHQLLRNDVTPKSGLLAPDTTGMNFYRADPVLADLLRIYLPDALFRHIEPHLDRLGALAGGPLDECARLADRHTPVLHQRDKFGRDVQTIEYHPAYRELEDAAFGEFGIHAMSIRKGILGWPDKYPVTAKHAFTFLFNQAEFGLGCPINVTDGCAKLLANFGSDALKDRYLDGLTQTDMAKLTQGGQFMTEKEGGSDVGTLTTTAVQEGDHWRLYGEKWFCSNADAKVVMLLARPEGAPPGTRGVGLFLMPRFLDDGSQNHYRIVRLKDKLGTRSMASGEIKLEGAIAYAVGKLDRGFVQMAEMVNSSRLSNGVKSTALMRRAYHDAMTVANNRVVFGSRIIDLPLGRRQLMKIMLATEQALSMSFLTADALDRAEGRQPGRGGAAAHPDADAEIPRHARRAQGLRRRARDARRHRLHRGVRHRAPVARRPSRLDLGRHRQYRGARCAQARGRPPRRGIGARRRSACAARRQRRRCRRPGATDCAGSPIAPSALRARSRPSPTTRPRRGAPPACSIMSQARCSSPGKRSASTQDARRCAPSSAVAAGDRSSRACRAIRSGLRKTRRKMRSRSCLLGERAAGMAEVGELIAAA